MSANLGTTRAPRGDRHGEADCLKDNCGSLGSARDDSRFRETTAGAETSSQQGSMRALLHAFVGVPDALLFADVEDLAYVVGIVRANMGDE